MNSNGGDTILDNSATNNSAPHKMKHGMQRAVPGLDLTSVVNAGGQVQSGILRRSSLLHTQQTQRPRGGQEDLFTIREKNQFPNNISQSDMSLVKTAGLPKSKSSLKSLQVRPKMTSATFGPDTRKAPSPTSSAGS